MSKPHKIPSAPIPLDPDRCAWSCPPEWVAFDTTEQLEVCEEDFGQAEAVEALTLALRLHGRGYNAYIAGLPGTGRTRTARRVMTEEARRGPTPDDLCYVHGFSDPRSPKPLRLPAGKGRRLREALSTATEQFKDGIAALRASTVHRRRRDEFSRTQLSAQSELLNSLQQEVQEEGFVLVEVNLGPYRQHELMPMVEGEPVAFEELESKVQSGEVEIDLDRLRERHPDLSARLAGTTAEVRGLRRDLEDKLHAMDRRAARPLVEETVELIRSAVGLREPHTEFDTYLNDLGEYLIEIVPMLYAVGERISEQLAEGHAPMGDPYDALKVNVLVDRSGQRGRPFVEESNPTLSRLFGYVEAHHSRDGVHADVSSIHAGAFHRADGGYLLINAHDLVAEEGGWSGVRRALRSGKISPYLGSGEGAPPLAPETAEFDVTLVIVGTPGLRAHLAEQDPEFKNLFKIVSLFDERVRLTRENVSDYACFLGQVSREEELLPHDSSAVARLLEAMVREAGGRNKLSTNFRLFIDLARESSYFAAQRGAKIVTREHVQHALAARRSRSAFLSTRIQDSFRDGLLQIDVAGEAIGQVNALAVVDSSFGAVGYPARVTVTNAVGTAGIIDIEREAELSGEIHTKASLILAGYLRSLFAQRAPLSMTASICFEQSYGGVEGDSASTAELAALLSSLGEVPLRQDLAITGAIDQHGKILAVGGVNHKIEGFWRVCQERGLTGSQGVLLPATSVSSMQLIPEVLAEIREKRFHVYPIQSVDEVVELMMGISLGRPDPSGTWPDGSLGQRIAQRLHGFAQVLRQFGPLEDH